MSPSWLRHKTLTLADACSNHAIPAKNPKAMLSDFYFIFNTKLIRDINVDT